MKIIIERLQEESLEDFADKNGLAVIVKERQNPAWGERFYASFVGVEVMDGRSLLVSAFGNGESPDEAIHRYALRISNQHLVKDAGRTYRKEMIAPKLYYARKNGAHDK